jgi:serine/threonine protein phosphatase PrpC
MLYVANLGDSRAVIGSLGRSSKVVAEQLTRDHNASMEEVRQELKSLHPDDSHIVVMKRGVWRIKGIIQVCFDSYDTNCVLALNLSLVFWVSPVCCPLRLFFNLENFLASLSKWVEILVFIIYHLSG